VPELAAREHLVAGRPVVETALKKARVSLKDLDAIAVTNGPGLIPALLVGLNLAKGIAISNNLPFIGINHFIAHIYATFLDGGTEDLQKKETYPISWHDY
jgi:N6-L-threonylcarbamoyladenine synthase